MTERANLAGGHDNITVIVAQFDGEVLRGPDDGDPLKYRKYVLPEEPTDPARKAVPTPSATAYDGAASAHAMTPNAAAPAAAWPGSFEEERIEIPGTHVPTGVVVALIVGVIALLAGTAFLLLR